MTSYQLFVHREVFEPLIASGTPFEATNARALKVECIALSADFREYTRFWEEMDVIARWSEHQPLASAMIDRVREHVRHVRDRAPRFFASRSPAQPQFFRLDGTAA